MIKKSDNTNDRQRIFGTDPAAVEILLFARGIPAIGNGPPILMFDWDMGGTD